MASCRAHPWNRATERQLQNVFLPAKAGRSARTVRMYNWVCKIDVRKASTEAMSLHEQMLLGQMAALTERIAELEAIAGRKKSKSLTPAIVEGDVIAEDEVLDETEDEDVDVDVAPKKSKKRKR